MATNWLKNWWKFSKIWVYNKIGQIIIYAQTYNIVTVEAGTFSPTVSATDHPSTAIIYGNTTWRLKLHHNYNVCRLALLTPRYRVKTTPVPENLFQCKINSDN